MEPCMDENTNNQPYLNTFNPYLRIFIQGVALIIEIQNDTSRKYNYYPSPLPLPFTYTMTTFKVLFFEKYFISCNSLIWQSKIG